MILNNIFKFLLFVSLLIQTSSAEVITPIPLDIKYDKQKALLGKKLFYDTRLSKSDTISCANCHLLEDGGDDNMQYSFGVDGQQGTLNAPTVLNAVFNFSQMRDGSAKDLADQVHFPITNPVEMGTTYKSIISKLKDDKEYKKLFNQAYGEDIKKESINDALSQFQTALTTPNSRFDKYLRGDKNALSKDEKDGFELFKKNGCAACHNGVNIGGNLYQRVGILTPYKHEEIDKTHELGRFNVTKKEYDKYLAKVPSLRNIELTAPYLHNGTVSNLEAMVRFMLKYQVGMNQNKKDIKKIVLFLKTLTGDTPSILKVKNNEK